MLLAGVYLAKAEPSTNVLASLWIAAGANVANWVYIEPKTTKLMFDRYDIENKPQKTSEDEANIKSLYKKFGMWHGISSLNNLVTLCATLAYGWVLAGNMML